MIKLKKALILFATFSILSILFLEATIRTLMKFELLPGGLSVFINEKNGKPVDTLNKTDWKEDLKKEGVVKYALEDILFEGERLIGLYAEGTVFQRPRDELTVNAYSGYWKEFDYSEEAIRVLTLGSSYTGGCCLKKDDYEYTFQRQAEKLLESRLKRNFQFADSSMNSQALFKRSYIIYGNKLVNKKVKHDYVLLELCLENFKGAKTDRYEMSKWQMNEIFLKSYALRFMVLATKSVSYYVDHLTRKSEGVDVDQQNRWMEKLRNIYKTDRPSFDLEKLLATFEPTHHEAYYKKALDEIREIPGTINEVESIDKLVKRAGAKLIVMIFPEFTKEELTVIGHELRKRDIKYVYLDSIRNYSNTKEWDIQHPYARSVHQRWAKEFVDKFIPLM